MSQLCAISKCGRTWRAPCDCCQQKLCLQHLNEHNILLIAQLNPLIDGINALADRLHTYFNHETIRDCRQKLEQWRKECHQNIDHFFKKKHQELDQLIAARVDKQQEKILHLRSVMSKFIQEQEATRYDIDSCAAVLGQLKKEMNKIEETCFRIDTQSLVINNSLVQIQETNIHDFDLAAVFHVNQSLDRPCASYMAITSNNQFLLVHQKPNLCLIDKEMNIVKQVLWDHDMIWDMCWSSALNRFIVIEENNIFLVDERTMSTEKIQINKKSKWASCVCSDEFLLLSTRMPGSSIVKVRLLPSMNIVQKWESSNKSAKYERIDGMACNNEIFVLMIRNRHDKSVRIELRSWTALDHIWSLSLDIVCNQDRRFNCCSLRADEWLVADYETERLLHITKDGKIKKTTSYKAIPYCITLLNTTILTVLRSGGINFHKL